MDYQGFAAWTSGQIEVGFQYFYNKPPFDSSDRIQSLLDRLNAIEGISLSAEVVTRRPSLPLTVLKHGDNLQQFLGVFDWVIEQIKFN
jgi:hypothetical protein